MGNGQAATLDGEPVVLGTFHPTFLYEFLWNIGVAILVWQLGKRLGLGRGRQFALYVAAYTAGRFWIEMLRNDPATEILGTRVNVWVSALVFLGAMAYLWLVRGSQEYLVALPEGTGYRVVTEDEFRAAQSAGSETGSDHTAEDGGDGDADGGDGPAGQSAQRSQTASGDGA
jgi:hypothetical protein